MRTIGGGYNKLIDGLLEGVETRTDTDFFKGHTDLTDLTDDAKGRMDLTDGKPLRDCWQEVAEKLLYTGAIDEYFGYRLGRLDWRTVSFEEEILDTPNYQGNAVMNNTEAEVPYTRIIEHKHFEMFGQEVYDCKKTVISREYSTEYREGMEPYYTVNDERNNRLADQYRELAAQEKNVIFGGRLAEYKYYDMAPIVEKVLGMEV